MWRPGKLRFLIEVKNRFLSGRPRPPENAAPCRAPPVARFATRSGYALPSSPIRRPFLILIDALFSSCLPRSSQMPAMRIERDDLHLRQPGRRAQFVADSLLEGDGFEPQSPPAS